MVLLIIGFVLILVSFAILWFAWHISKKIALMAEVETVPAAEVAGRVGQVVEVKGKVACDEPLSARISGASCAPFELTEEEESRDSQGNSQWRTVRSEFRSTPFYVEDGTGRDLVNPKGAVLYTEEVYRSDDKPSAGLNVSFGEISFGTGNSGTRRRLRENAVPIGCDIYVLGEAATTEGDPAIRKSADQRFLVSTRSEEELTSHLRGARRVLGLFFIAFFAAGLIATIAGIMQRFG